jgi:uncharacterized protein
MDTDEVAVLLAQSSIDAVPGSAEVELELKLTRAEDVVLVQGWIKGRFNVPCARCLTPAPILVDERELKLTFFPPTAAVDDEEVELDLEDLDTYTHDGQQIDLEPLVRELLILAIPIMPLCREDCKGICSRCGIDLNLESCSCRGEEFPKSSWAAALCKLKNTSGG